MMAEKRERDIEVLITGFGPFLKFSENPSWLAIKDLHDSYLEPLALPCAAQAGTRGRIHIQTLQTSVCYSHVLDLVPRIHRQAKPAGRVHRPFLDPLGEKPDESGQGPQGNGRSFPEGYNAQLPSEGRAAFDIVIHVGVGRPGNIAIEKVGHKRGYAKPDVKGELAPPATDQHRNMLPSGPTEAERAEHDNFLKAGVAPAETAGTSIVRGFGEGFEQFPEEQVNDVDVSALVDWLIKEKGLENVRESRDAGRFLCDFIYYCSLSEAQRSANSEGEKTTVLFVHVPPTGEPHGTVDAQETVTSITSWLASFRHHRR